MVAVRKPQMHHAAAEHADHHRLDDGEREKGGDRCVDGVATGQHDLRAGRRGEWMIGHDHAARAGGGPLFKREGYCVCHGSKYRPPVIGVGAPVVVGRLMGRPSRARTAR